jgi:hypothetical protein
MGVSRSDFRGIAVKVFGEDLLASYKACQFGDNKLLELIIVQDWLRPQLTAAERSAIRLIHKGYFGGAGYFVFDPDDIKRNCNNCRHVTDDGKDCTVFATRGTCHVSIPNLWEAKEGV